MEPLRLTLAVETHPGAVEVHPEAGEAHPGAVEAYPRSETVLLTQEQKNKFRFFK
jgi:hypothetical protein